MKKLLSILMAVCLVAVLLPVQAHAATFNDVDGHWGEAAIERWAGYKVLNGKGGGVFDPEGTMTRAEFATMLVNMMGYTKTSTKTFVDLDPNEWYADAISKLVAAQVMNGVGDNMVDPNGQITREQAAVMLCRAFGIKPSGSGSLSFTDSANVSDWAVEAMTALSERGMINGVGDNLLSPEGIVNRATAAQLASNMVAEYVTSDTVITGSVDGVVIVAKGARVEIKDATVTAPIVVENAAVTLTNTKAENVKVEGSSASVTADARSSVTDVSLAGDAPKADIKGAVSGTVTVEEGATGATATLPQGTSVSNESGSTATVNGSSQASGTTSSAPSTSSGGGGGGYTPSRPGGSGSGSGGTTTKPPAGSDGETPVTKPDDPQAPEVGTVDKTQDKTDPETTESALGDGHTCNYTVKVSETESTCQAQGVTVMKCETEGCGSTKTTYAATADHKKSDTVLKTEPATCSADGYISYKCEWCNAVASVTNLTDRPAHEYSTGWTYDDNNHWHQCKNCGAVEGTKGTHSGSGWVSTGADGHQGVCECGKTMTASHGTLTNVENTAKEATCKADGKEADKKCPDCNYVETGKTILKSTVAHTPKGTYETSATEHWKVCSVCGTEIENSRAAHSHGDDGSADCVCGAKGTTVEPEPEPEHEHQFSQWTSDNKGGHTRTCTGTTGTCSLTADSTELKGTCDEKGEDGACSACGYKAAVVSPPAGDSGNSEGT